MTYKDNIWKMKLYSFLREFYLFAGILVPFFTDWGNISFFQVSILQAIFVVSVFLFEIPTGALADKLGRKKSLFFASLFSTLAIIVYAISPNFIIFIIAEIIWGLSVALLSGAQDSIVYDSLKATKTEKNSQKIFGQFRSYHILAIGIAAPIGSYLVPYIGLRNIMFLSAIGPFLAMLVALTFKEPIINIKKKNYLLIIKNGLKIFKENKVIQILTFDRASSITFVMVMFIAYQHSLSYMDISIQNYGWIHLLIVLGQFIVLNSFTFFSNLFKSKRRMLFYFALIPAISYIGMGLIDSIIIWILLLVFAQGFGYPRDVLFVNYLNKHIESDQRATILSIISMIKSLAFAIIYLVAGYFMEINWKLTLIGFGIVMLISQIISRVKEEHLLD
jgi:MFS family permease